MGSGPSNIPVPEQIPFLVRFRSNEPIIPSARQSARMVGGARPVPGGEVARRGGCRRAKELPGPRPSLREPLAKRRRRAVGSEVRAICRQVAKSTYPGLSDLKAHVGGIYLSIDLSTRRLDLPGSAWPGTRFARSSLRAAGRAGRWVRQSRYQGSVICGWPCGGTLGDLRSAEFLIALERRPLIFAPPATLAREESVPQPGGASSSGKGEGSETLRVKSMARVNASRAFGTVARPGPSKGICSGAASGTCGCGAIG